MLRSIRVARWMSSGMSLLLLGGVASLLGLVVLPPSSTQACGVIDQHSDDGGRATIDLYSSSDRAAQTFTAGITGDIDQVDLRLFRDLSVSSLTVEIRTTAGGDPTATVIGSGSLAEIDIPTVETVVSIPLTVVAPVVAGTEYAVVVYGTGFDSCAALIIFVDSPGPYASGKAFAASGGPFVADPATDAAFTTYVLASTATPTPTPSATPTPSITPTPLVATATPTPTPTNTPIPPPADTNKPDSTKKKTDEERQQDEQTNQSNRDDIHTEGNVIEVGQDEQGPFVVIVNRDGPVVVRLQCGDQCPTIRVGDYVQFDGVKEHEALFYADDASVSRP